MKIKFYLKKTEGGCLEINIWQALIPCSALVINELTAIVTRKNVLL